MIRIPLLFFYKITGKIDSLIERASCTTIGHTGNVSVIDKYIAQKHKLAPLNRFERWLLEPIIEAEKKRRRENFW